MIQITETELTARLVCVTANRAELGRVRRQSGQSFSSQISILTTWCKQETRTRTSNLVALSSHKIILMDQIDIQISPRRAMDDVASCGAIA